MNILSFTTLFPSSINPLHGLFVKERVSAMSQKSDLRVIAPVPYFPDIPLLNSLAALKRYSAYSKVPYRENFAGLNIEHPRHKTFPKVLKSYDGDFIYQGARKIALELHSKYQFDVIDGHWAYPDGYAVMKLAQELKLPYTITIRGDDISIFADIPGRREKIITTLQNASQVIGVCKALCDRAIEIAGVENKCTVIGNGIDITRFQAMEREQARKQLGLPIDKKILLSVGHLCERKGFQILIDALKLLQDDGNTDIILAIVGGAGEEGDFLQTLEEKANQCLSGSVIFAGAKPPEELSDWYSAADVFCLASSREGWANVLMEALACGTPVVATNVWGTPEIVTHDALGFLTDRNEHDFATTIDKALKTDFNRQTLIDHVKTRTWDKVADEVLSCFKSILDKP